MDQKLKAYAAIEAAYMRFEGEPRPMVHELATAILHEFEVRGIELVSSEYLTTMMDQLEAMRLSKN